MKRKLTVAALATFAAFGAQAEEAPQPQGYFGGNYVFLTYEEDGIDEDFDLGALVGKAGVNVNPYLAAELRVGFGVKDYSISGNGVTAELEVDYLVGGYIVAGIPNSSPIYPYAVLGATKAELTATVRAFGESASVSDSDSDVSYGVGANFAVNEQVSLNAEYMSYLDKDSVKISGISIGGAVRF